MRSRAGLRWGPKQLGSDKLGSCATAESVESAALVCGSSRVGTAPFAYGSCLVNVVGD